MTNIAQIANVLQSMVLTRGPQMVLTPTYYVFKMYASHQGGRLIPVDVDCEYIIADDGRRVPVVSATASAHDNSNILSLVNTDLSRSTNVKVNLGDIKAKDITGEILCASSITDYNDFGQPEKVALKQLSSRDWKVKDGILSITLPPASIVTLTLARP